MTIYNTGQQLLGTSRCWFCKQKEDLLEHLSLQLTCVDSFVDFEVFRSGKDLAAAREGTGKGLLSSVNPNVVHQFVLGLEGASLPGAVFPVAGMVGDLWSTHVFQGNVGHNFVQGTENFIARFLW